MKNDRLPNLCYVCPNVVVAHMLSSSPSPCHMSHNLNSLKEAIGDIQRDTRSLDCGSYKEISDAPKSKVADLIEA